MSSIAIHTISGGTVSVEDGIKAKEEYAPARKVRVDLNFTVPEGADCGAYLDGAASLADAKVSELLGRGFKRPAATAATVTLVPEKTTPVVPVAETAAAKKARLAAEKAANKPAEKTKADLEKEMLAAATKPADESVIEADDSTEPEDDGLSDILGEPEAPPVTDAELSSSCVKKAEKMKGVAGWEPMKLRKLIEKFTGAAGKHNREIPAAKRPDFLKELEALK